MTFTAEEEAEELELTAEQELGKLRWPKEIQYEVHWLAGVTQY